MKLVEGKPTYLGYLIVGPNDAGKIEWELYTARTDYKRENEAEAGCAYSGELRARLRQSTRTKPPAPVPQDLERKAAEAAAEMANVSAKDALALLAQLDPCNYDVANLQSWLEMCRGQYKRPPFDNPGSPCDQAPQTTPFCDN